VALLEVVVVLPVLLYVVLGTVEFGQYFYIRSCFEGAARDAARAAILETAQQSDPATKAAATLLQANVTFSPSWMTIVDYTNSNAVITDVSQVPYGHTLIVTIQVQYRLIPNAFRPLSTMTGFGIGTSRICSGQCQMIKE
jgi:Flp pilus assembly protein TadG